MAERSSNDLPLAAISSRTLEEAIRQGLISREISDRLLAIEQGAPVDPSSIEDEQFRFIRGFSDIFVTIGLLMFLGAVGWFAGASAGSPIGYALVTAVAWGLSEYFTRIRRMSLPSIVLLVIFAGSAFWSIVAAATLSPSLAGSPLGLIIPAVGTALLLWLHYRRFQVPITVAAGAAALAILFVALIGWVFGLSFGWYDQTLNLAVMIAGLAVFALAMRFDLSDRKRVTRRTDIAFWLHMLAAPMIVHPLIVMLFGPGAETVTGIADALALLAVFALLAVIALAVDRRAILVSGLTYAGIAFGAIAGRAGLSSELPWTLLVLGAIVLILSAGWQTIRQRLLGVLPARLSGHLSH